ncbi:MAG TPA: hypothetical protein VHZ03_57420 [Trebonia sp.]|nr:hypothetical protein [Trebonia sp.]
MPDNLAPVHHLEHPVVIRAALDDIADERHPLLPANPDRVARAVPVLDADIEWPDTQVRFDTPGVFEI